MMFPKKICRIAVNILTVSCLLFGSSCATERNSTKGVLETVPNVLIIGDSISIGYTGKVRQLLSDTACVSRPHNANGSVINCGSTAMGLEGVDAWLGKTKWDVIHFNWGLWDLCYRHPDSKVQGNRDKINGTVTATPQVYEDNLCKLVQRLKATGAVLIWATTTPVPEGEAGRYKSDAAKYNAIAKKVMDENGIAIDDLYSHMLPVAEKYYTKPGNVHYTKQGYEYLAEQVAAAIEKNLAP